jgi:N-acetylmuramoyl-L-alanine amidase
MNFLQMFKFITTTKNLLTLGFLILVLFPIHAQKNYTIVLDAGHGGKDSGNRGNGYYEKHIALKVTLAVGRILEKEKDIKIIYTRKTDIYPELWKRGEIANNAKADLFVSIHCDSYLPRPEAHGAGTFVLGLRGNKKNLEFAKRENAGVLLEENYEQRYKGFNTNSVESVLGLSLLQEENLDKSLEIASLIQGNFTKQLNRLDRKVKQDNFQVLRETVMPSVLVELGFLTNKKEGKYLNSKKGQLQMANAIADALKKYVTNLKINTVKNSAIAFTPLKEVSTVIEYKVQIASSKTKLATKSYNFKGLKNVQRIKVGRYYKYYYGITNSLKSTKKYLEKAKKKGYTSAFLVAFKNGEKVSVKK